MHEVNLYLDFDCTQVDGHLHNILVRALINKDFPNHPTPPKVYGFDEVADILENTEKEIPEEVKAWIDQKIEENGLQFFNSKLLGEKLNEYKDLGVHVSVLTASSVPAAIRHMYQKYELDHLIDRVNTVSTEGSAKKKALLIEGREDVVLEKDENNSVVSIFADDRQENITAFNEIPLKAGVNRMGIHVNREKGLTKDVFDSIDNLLKMDVRLAQRRDTISVNTPEKVEEMKLEAAKRGTIYQNIPKIKTPIEIREMLKQMKLEAAKRGTIYENTPEEVEKVKLEADKRGTIYQNIPKIKTPIEIRKMLKELKLDDSPIKSNRVSLHFGDTDFDRENLSKKITGLEYIKDNSTQNTMLGMTNSSIKLSPAAAAAASATAASIGPKSNTLLPPKGEKGLSRKGGIRRGGIRKK